MQAFQSALGSDSRGGFAGTRLITRTVTIHTVTTPTARLIIPGRLSTTVADIGLIIGGTAAGSIIGAISGAKFLSRVPSDPKLAVSSLARHPKRKRGPRLRSWVTQIKM